MTIEQRKISLELFRSTRVNKVKEMIKERAEIPVDQQRLIFNHKQLEDHQTLEQCGVEDGATINLVLRLADRSETDPR